MNQTNLQRGAYLTTIVTLPIMVITVLVVAWNINSKLTQVHEAIQPVADALGAKAVDSIKRIDANKVKDQAEDTIEEGFEALKRRFNKDKEND